MIEFLDFDTFLECFHLNKEISRTLKNSRIINLKYWYNHYKSFLFQSPENLEKRDELIPYVEREFESVMERMSVVDMKYYQEKLKILLSFRKKRVITKNSVMFDKLEVWYSAFSRDGRYVGICGEEQFLVCERMNKDDDWDFRKVRRFSGTNSISCGFSDNNEFVYVITEPGHLLIFELERDRIKKFMKEREIDESFVNFSEFELMMKSHQRFKNDYIPIGKRDEMDYREISFFKRVENYDNRPSFVNENFIFYLQVRKEGFSGVDSFVVRSLIPDFLLYELTVGTTNNYTSFGGKDFSSCYSVDGELIRDKEIIECHTVCMEKNERRKFILNIDNRKFSFDNSNTMLFCEIPSKERLEEVYLQKLKEKKGENCSKNSNLFRRLKRDHTIREGRKVTEMEFLCLNAAISQTSYIDNKIYASTREYRKIEKKEKEEVGEGEENDGEVDYEISEYQISIIDDVQKRVILKLSPFIPSHSQICYMLYPDISEDFVGIGSEVSSLFFWDSKNFGYLGSVKKHNHPVSCVSFSPSKKNIFATSSDEGILRIMSIENEDVDDTHGDALAELVMNENMEEENDLNGMDEEGRILDELLMEEDPPTLRELEDQLRNFRNNFREGDRNFLADEDFLNFLFGERNVTENLGENSGEDEDSGNENQNNGIEDEENR